MGYFKVYTTSDKKLGQTAPSAWICPKTQFWGPLASWKFEPSPRPHTHSDPIINKHTERVKKLRLDLSWYALTSQLQVKLSNTLKRQGFGYPGFQKNSRHTHQNWLKLSPVSERSAYPLQNYVCFSPLTSGLESFGHKSAPSHRPWIRPWRIILKNCPIMLCSNALKALHSRCFIFKFFSTV